MNPELKYLKQLIEDDDSWIKIHLAVPYYAPLLGEINELLKSVPDVDVLAEDEIDKRREIVDDLEDFIAGFLVEIFMINEEYDYIKEKDHEASQREKLRNYWLFILASLTSSSINNVDLLSKDIELNRNVGLFLAVIAYTFMILAVSNIYDRYSDRILGAGNRLLSSVKARLVGNNEDDEESLPGIIDTGSEFQWNEIRKLKLSLGEYLKTTDLNQELQAKIYRIVVDHIEKWKKSR